MGFYLPCSGLRSPRVLKSTVLRGHQWNRTYVDELSRRPVTRCPRLADPSADSEEAVRGRCHNEHSGDG
jgi:hypothetical protein